MIFHGFYNYDHIGDIMLARCGEGKTFDYNKYDDLVVLKDENGNIIGYNLLNASKHLGKINNGLIDFNEHQIETFNKLLDKNNLAPVVIDKTPRFIVGEIISMTEHPDSDHLHVCQVDLKTEQTQIVCGAPNVDIGQRVVVATVGAIMPSGLIIKPSKLRKIDSNGMICSARELGLPNAPQVRGILVLDKDKYNVGDSFF
ncbi:MAG: YtpR family tRNA-binding protein [Thomasclavelia sp.]|uniref:YtpR family tRNA-binding protein n=1 Tax=Thomasclavelia sp. TaxID=3025757 RepID=UPI0039A33C9C